MIKRISFISVFAALVLLPAAMLAASAPISIVASNWKYTPSTITLKAGQTQTLHFTSSEGVHGVQSSDLGIALTTIVPGKGVDVTVTPKKAGVYVLPCEIFCGAGHADMKLTIKVVP